MERGVIVPMGLKNYKDIGAVNSLARHDSFPYHGIWLFSGAQGNGKTLLMMYVLHEMIKDYPKAIIVSDIALYGIPCIPYSGISDFDDYNNGQDGIIFVLDEIQTLWSSLESKRISPSQLTVWSQNRKNRRVILGTSQRFSRIAKPIREQAILHYECLPSIFSIRRYRCFDATLYDDDGKYIGPPQKTHIYIPPLRVMTSYSTLEVVERSKYVND